MSKEELLLECWRELPPESQEKVLQLAKYLKPDRKFSPETPLAQKLWEIRQRAIANGMKLLTQEELDRELVERRGGYRES
jgi:hypothetical protein